MTSEKISDSDLRKQLKSFGIDIGPLTDDSIRKIYFKKLEKLKSSEKPSANNQPVKTGHTNNSWAGNSVPTQDNTPQRQQAQQSFLQPSPRNQQSVVAKVTHDFVENFYAQLPPSKVSTLSRAPKSTASVNNKKEIPPPSSANLRRQSTAHTLEMASALKDDSQPVKTDHTNNSGAWNLVPNQDNTRQCQQTRQSFPQPSPRNQQSVVAKVTDNFVENSDAQLPPSKVSTPSRAPKSTVSVNGKKEIPPPSANLRCRSTAHTLEMASASKDMHDSRKRKSADCDEIQKKKTRLESDIAMLVSEADQLAKRAEAECDMSLLVKSNAFRKAAEDKRESLTHTIK